MTDLLKLAQEYLGRIRTTYLATENTIVYTRLADAEVPYDNTVISLTGVVIAAYRREEEPQIDVGSALMSERRDYIVPVDQLPGGEPLDGEQIAETQDTTTYTYKVTGEYGQRSWEWHDRQRTAYRIHTIFSSED